MSFGNYVHLADLAFDLLDSAEVLHEFDDSVTLRVNREQWLEYIKQGEM
jgi:hypothetical protein